MLFLFNKHYISGIILFRKFLTLQIMFTYQLKNISDYNNNNNGIDNSANIFVTIPKPETVTENG